MIGRWIFVRDGRLSRTGWIALVLIAALLLVVFFPLRLALGGLDDDGVFAARKADGSIWDGRLHDARLAGLPLGTLDVGLKPLSLASGAMFAVARPEYPGQPGFAAEIGRRGGDFSIANANGEVDLRGALGPLPMRAVTFANFAMAGSDGRCTSAAGTLGLVLPSLGPLIPGETVFAGEVRCEDGAVIAPMAGPTGTERVIFRLDPGGQWSADLQLTGLPIEVSAPLLQMGFTGRPGGIGLSASGEF